MNCRYKKQKPPTPLGQPPVHRSWISIFLVHNISKSCEIIHSI